MGTQGEIYNIFGLIWPAQEVERNKRYRVNGLEVVIGDEVSRDVLRHGIPTSQVNLENPRLIIRLGGYVNDDWIKGQNFNGSALAGYVVARESYEGCLISVPPQKVLDGLKPRLLADLKQTLGYEGTDEGLSLFLVFDSLQNRGKDPSFRDQ